MRETTWEPHEHLLGYGAEEIVQEYLKKNKDKDDAKVVAYMVQHIEHQTELDKTVAYLMRKHKLQGTLTLSDWRPGYAAELEEVLARRCIRKVPPSLKQKMENVFGA